ncbi:hypothetical protein [Nocardioides sp.]|uniref:hypothetical protein n=1 Tax=Nocardioides sp. TaxID=35761 RepID=UPI002D7FDD19|nr:hypothetical protein [Nocardioides sp.]
MRTSLTRTVIALAASSAVMGLGAAPASAENWRGSDPAGDVMTYTSSPEPPPCGTFTEGADPANHTADLVSLAVRHRRDTVELSAGFRDFTGGGQQSLEFDVKTDKHEFSISLDRRRTGAAARISVLRPGEPSAPDECGYYTVMSLVDPCRGLEADLSPSLDVVSVVLPRGCLGDPRWIRVGVQTGRSAGEAWSTDIWAEPGVDTAVYTGPYGPRVRRG